MTKYIIIKADGRDDGCKPSLEGTFNSKKDAQSALADLFKKAKEQDMCHIEEVTEEQTSDSFTIKNSDYEYDCISAKIVEISI